MGKAARNSVLGIATLLTSICIGVMPVHGGALGSGPLIAPDSVGEMDCNGWSPTYASVRPAMRSLCADPINTAAAEQRRRSLPSSGYGGGDSRFEDNGHYVGHDEPATRFISSASGSGGSMTYFMQLPTSGSSTDFAELSAAPWFAIPLCDPNSAPENSCSPASDRNSSDPTTGAGSAVLELQFYAPKYGPFIDGVSCDATQWCAAMNIDSLECSPTLGCNNSCMEPANFAYLTHDGHPIGPPSPQQTTLQSLTANNDALKFDEGDTLRVTIQDTPSGVLTRVDDFSTGQSGFMAASAANGFMSTDPNTCDGSAFTFRAEYDTAAATNVVPWAALNLGVTASVETGHFESCTGITNQETASQANFPRGFSDAAVSQTCTGSSEVAGASSGSGEGPCTNSGCSGVNEGGGECTSARSGPCELSDAYCLPSGARTVTVLGVSQTWSWPRSGCTDTQFQNGDLDFDGTPYQADWPDGSAAHPTSAKYLGPFDTHGSQYAQVQFETNVPLAESGCNTTSNAGCSVPPKAPDGSNSNTFYPFWSSETGDQIAGLHPSVSSPCIWNFGNDVAGVTTNDFGKTAQYGSISLGLASSSAQPNPPSGCPTITLTQADPAVALGLQPASGIRSPGSPFSVTVFAADAAGFVPASAFTDTMAFSSSDGAAGLPSNYAFTSADKGAHTFSITLSTPGTSTVSVRDVTNSAVTAATGTYRVVRTQQDVFWRDGAGHLQESWYFAGTWYGPLDLTAAVFGGGAPLQSAPDAQVTPDGSQQIVFWQGPGNHLFEAWYAVGGWHGPLDLTAAFLGGAATLVSAPSAQATPDGSQQIVFWQGPGNDLFEAWYTQGGWHGPLDLSASIFGGAAPLGSSPGAQVTADGSQQLVFWQGPSSHLDEAWYAQGGWHGPLDLTLAAFSGAAGLQSSPAPAVTPDGSQELVFYAGPGDGLNEGWYAQGGWHGPLDLTSAFLGGAAPLQSAPGVTVLPDGSQQLAFWQGPGGDLFEAWFALGGWHGPIDLTAQFHAAPIAAAPSVAIDLIF